MPTEQFANNAQTTLSSAITSSTDPIPVASASGFPGQAQFRIRIDDEILLVTSGAGTTSWSVTRGLEGTMAVGHSSGAAVTHVLTAAALQNLDAAVIATGQLALARGGTAGDLSGTGGAGQYVKQSTAGAALTVGVIAAADLPIFVASGSGHAPGAVPDPGATAGSTRYLREDATWQTPSGGFTNPMTTLGDLVYENATPAAARLAGNTTTTRNFLRQVGTGSASAAPAWDTLQAADIPSLSGSIIGSGQVGAAYGGVATGTILAYGGYSAPSGYLLCDGSSCSRTTYANLFAALSLSITASISGSPTSTLSSVSPTPSADWLGAAIQGPGIPSNSIITAINAGSGTVSINQMTTSNETSQTSTIIPYGVAAGSTTSFNVPDLQGRVPVGADPAQVNTPDLSGVGGASGVPYVGVTGGEDKHSLVVGEGTVEAHVHNFLSNGHTVGILDTGTSGVNDVTTASGTFLFDQPTTVQAPTTAGASHPHNNMQPWQGVKYIIKT